jgi:hypothetical protein
MPLVISHSPPRPLSKPHHRQRPESASRIRTKSVSEPSEIAHIFKTTPIKQASPSIGGDEDKFGQST